MSLTTPEEKEELQNLILDKLCDKIEGFENAEEEEEKSINSVATKTHILIEEWKEMFHWITRQQVDSRLIQRKNEKEKAGTATTATTTAAAAAAALEREEEEEAENDNNKKVSEIEAQNGGGGDDNATTTAFNNENNNVGQQQRLSPPEQEPTQNKHTTKTKTKTTTSKKRTLKKNPVQPLDIRKKIYKLKDEITADYGWLKGLNSKKKLAKGTLEKLIEKKKREYGLEDVEIKAETIRTRWKNSKVGVQVQHGNTSPLEGIEPMIIDQIRKRKLHDQNNPMKKKDIIQCANTILLQQQTTQTNNGNDDDSSSVMVVQNSDGKGKGRIKENNVGNGWYENFRVRWQPELLELGYEPKQKRSKKTLQQQQQQQSGSSRVTLVETTTADDDDMPTDGITTTTKPNGNDFC